MFEVDSPPLRASGPHAQDRARARQRVRHRHEVVLPAHAADDAAVREPIGHGRAEQRHHHRRVHEARIAPLQDAQLLSGP